MSFHDREYPDFLMRLASAVAALVEDEAVLRWFQAKVREWAAGSVAEWRTQSEQDKRALASYFLPIATEQERQGWCYTPWACPSSKGSPDWQWLKWVGRDDDGNEVVAAGWAPEELVELIYEEPNENFPLPLPKLRRLSISECYAVLAAIQDTAGEMGQINPFADDADPANLEALNYFLLRDGVVNIAKTSKGGLRRILGRVDEDLRSNGFAASQLVIRVTTAAPRVQPPNTTHDKKSDTEKKPRTMNTAAADVARRYRKIVLEGDRAVTIKSVAEDYVEEQGEGTVKSILRTLTDNPDQWKKHPDIGDTNTTQTRHS